ncbi:putative WD repeat-containing protein WRAP73-like [Capsicum annuum]|nr:putative WD repeat-containing protein WRAP73-like [Capsicum annuum]
MANGKVENGGVFSSETFNGGKDVFSSKASDASTADHLVMMVHGILGREKAGLLIRFFHNSIKMLPKMFGVYRKQPLSTRKKENLFFFSKILHSWEEEEADRTKALSTSSEVVVWAAYTLPSPDPTLLEYTGYVVVVVSRKENAFFDCASDWKFGAEQFVRNLPDKVFVHCSERNMAKLTLDGVDIMGERLAEEVLDVTKRKPGLKKISFVAHSVGGVVARYAIGKLYRPPRAENVEKFSDDTSEEWLKGTIAGLEPINFITVASPHLGSRGNKQWFNEVGMSTMGSQVQFPAETNTKCFLPICSSLGGQSYLISVAGGRWQVPFLFGVTAFEKAAGLCVHWIFKRTGRHLFLNEDEGKPPLLRRMVEDDVELRFMSALGSFKRRVAYSNWEDSLNEKYPHIVYQEHCKACDSEQGECVVKEDDCLDKLEEELVTGLSRVSWEKIDVSFHSSRNRFAAHSVIQATVIDSRTSAYSRTSGSAWKKETADDDVAWGRNNDFDLLWKKETMPFGTNRCLMVTESSVRKADLRSSLISVAHHGVDSVKIVLVSRDYDIHELYCLSSSPCITPPVSLQ